MDLRKASRILITDSPKNTEAMNNTDREPDWNKLAEQYADEVTLEENTYRGDVVTAFLQGMEKHEELSTPPTESVEEAVREYAKSHDFEGDLGSFGASCYRDGYLDGAATHPTPESEGVEDSDLYLAIETLRSIPGVNVDVFVEEARKLEAQARQEERGRVIDKISEIEQDWKDAGDYRKADACEYLKSQLGVSDE